MVSFRNLLVSALALATPITAQTSTQIVANIQLITQKSAALQAPAQSITLINGPLIVIGQGPFPQLIAGFVDIVATATTVIAQSQNMPPVPAGAESDAIFNAFREFVRVHQALLNTLIGKAGLFNTVPFVGQPIAAVLRQVENIVDTIAFMLINNVQSRAADLQSQATSLSQTITITINSYSGAVKEKRSLRFLPRELLAEA